MPRGRNDYETAQIQGRLWTPAVLRPAMWLDAADLSTISIATGVSEWRDKSGFGQNATQATGTSQPSLFAESFNGLNTILFDGTNDNMGFDGTFLASTSYLMVVVFARRSTSACFAVGRASPLGPNNSQFAIGYSNSTTLDYGQYGNDLTGTVAAYGGTPRLDIIVCRKITTAGGGTILRQNGTAIASNANTTGISSYTNARLGQQDYYGQIYHNLNLAEIVSCTGARSGLDNLFAIQNLEGYLSWKWGIPLTASHPFANRPPLIGD